MKRRPGVIVTGTPDANDGGYLRVANSLIRDERLSWTAKGLAVFIASHGRDYCLSERRIVAAGVGGRAKVRTALTQLEDFGYLEREQLREAGRVIGSIYTLHQIPTVVGKTDHGGTDHGGADHGETDLRKPDHLRRTKGKKDQEEKDQEEKKKKNSSEEVPPSCARKAGDTAEIDISKDRKDDIDRIGEEIAEVMLEVRSAHAIHEISEQQVRIAAEQLEVLRQDRDETVSHMATWAAGKMIDLHSRGVINGSGLWIRIMRTDYDQWAERGRPTHPKLIQHRARKARESVPAYDPSRYETDLEPTPKRQFSPEEEALIAELAAL